MRELIDRRQRMVERRIRAARFPDVKSLDTFDFPAIPAVNKQLVTELTRCEDVQNRENVIAVGNSGALPKNSRQGDGALQAFEAGCGVPVGGLQADYEAFARLPKTETRNLLDGHSSWWRLRAESVISYLKMPFLRALVG